MEVRLRSAREAEKDNVRAWLRLGKEYTVLAIEHLSSDQGPAYRIASEQVSPVLFEVGLFTITDPRVSPRWIVRRYDSGEIDFVPEAWNVPGFWEDLFDRDAEAVAIYEEELALMTAQSRRGG